MLNAENKKIKVLVVGDFVSQIHELAIYKSFIKLGINTEKFSLVEYFHNFLFVNPKNFFDFLLSFYYKIQNKFSFGPTIFFINKALISYVKKNKTDLIFIYRGKHIFSNTVKELKKNGSLVFGYNNDDPFSKKYPFYFWRHFRRSIFAYDHIFVYRQKNFNDYKKINYKKVSFLRSYYIKELNYPIDHFKKNKYTCDISFIGHFENDGRDEYIKTILDAGIDLQLHGPEWERSKFFDFFQKRFGVIQSLENDYNLALNSTKIALVFLSKLNNDTYTRRCFEIPATKTFMLSEYSEDLASLFIPQKEADYFTNKEELVEKIKYYLSHDEEREKIAIAGYTRLINDKHDVISRVQEILDTFNNYKK